MKSVLEYNDLDVNALKVTIEVLKRRLSQYEVSHHIACMI